MAALRLAGAPALGLGTAGYGDTLHRCGANGIGEQIIKEKSHRRASRRRARGHPVPH